MRRSAAAHGPPCSRAVVPHCYCLILLPCQPSWAHARVPCYELSHKSQDMTGWRLAHSMVLLRVCAARCCVFR